MKLERFSLKETRDETSIILASVCVWDSCRTADCTISPNARTTNEYDISGRDGLAMTTLLLIAAFLCVAYLLTHSGDKPLPYLFCNECNGDLTEHGWCNTCRAFRPH